MAEYPAKRHPNIKPTHPGEILREDVLPALEKTSKTEIARLLGLSRQALYDILNEKAPVTAETAVKLGKLCGNGPNIWIRLQRDYDLWHAQRKVDVSGIPTLQEAAD
jgi:addiction module HigA family antidote